MLRSLVLVTALGAAWAADDGGDYDRNLASFGAWGHPVSLDTQAQDGLAPGEGLQIRWVRPGGPAAQMGLQPGDVIMSLNGNPISSRLDLRNAVISNAPGSAATAVVVRPGGDVAVLDGTFGERRSKRPLRPLTDDWEQRVMQQQLEELDRRARELEQLQRDLAELDPDGAPADDADSAAKAGAGGSGDDDAALGDAAAPVSGPWFVSHRWHAPTAPLGEAVASAAPAPVDDQQPWRFTATVGLSAQP